MQKIYDKKYNIFKLDVCGRSLAELEKYDNIMYYPNFSQRMDERIKNGK